MLLARRVQLLIRPQIHIHIYRPHFRHERVAEGGLQRCRPVRDERWGVGVLFVEVLYDFERVGDDGGGGWVGDDGDGVVRFIAV